MLLAAVIVEIFSRKRTLAAGLLITGVCTAALIASPAQVGTLRAQEIGLQHHRYSSVCKVLCKLLCAHLHCRCFYGAAGPVPWAPLQFCSSTRQRCAVGCCAVPTAVGLPLLLA